MDYGWIIILIILGFFTVIFVINTIENINAFRSHRRRATAAKMIRQHDNP